MSLGQNDNAILKLLADEQLRKENAALAAEIGQLKQDYLQLRIRNGNLAAENERLSRMFAELETPYLSNNLIDSAYAEKLKALTAENERLRKAGDAMYGYITNVILDGRISSPYLNKLQDDWDNAAKEGRDAK